MKQEELDAHCIITLRFLSIGQVEKAGSGRARLPKRAAKMAYALGSEFLRFSPKNSNLQNSSRFVRKAETINKTKRKLIGTRC